MKNLIRYLNQDTEGHKHLSELLKTENPSYTFSPQHSMEYVMDWSHKKQSELKEDEKLIIVNVLKLED